MLDRIGDWKTFNGQVEKHIEQYTIPQYQSDDDKTDQVGAWTAEDCKKAIERYVNRFGKGARGPVEALRDCLKIAHYSSFMYDKLKVELSESDIY